MTTFRIQRMSLALALICSRCVLAQQATAPSEDEMETKVKLLGGMHSRSANGKAWKVLDGQSKITLVMGIEEGMLLVMKYLGTSGFSMEEVKRINTDLHVTGFRMSDLADQIEAVYRDSANLRIPIIEIYRRVIGKMRGATNQEFEEQLSKLRREYNR